MNLLTNNEVNNTDLGNQKDIFLSILEDHKGIIYKVANSYCRDHEDKKDLVQEIIIQLWQSFEKYNNQFKYSTWIYTISLNTSISFYRKKSKPINKTIELKGILETPISDNATHEEDANIQLLQRFIRELREIDKALILLYLEGLNQKEISDIIGISASNVSTKVGRIKKILKEKFLNHNKSSS